MSEATTRAEEDTRALISELEYELGVTGTAAVFRKALAIAKESIRAGEYSGFSGAGIQQVIGSRSDIDLVQRWCQEAGTIPYLQDRIKSAESRAASAEAEVADLRKSLAACMADLERGRLSKRVYSDAALGSELEAAEASASALRDRVAVLESALKPFAEEADSLEACDRGHLWESPQAMNLTADHLRAARAALNGADHA